MTSKELTALSPSGTPYYVLCADMGSTRTKAAVVRKGISLDELRTVQVIILDSKPWWGPKCPQLFDRTDPESLASRVQRVFQAISLSISGLVLHQEYLSLYRGVPQDLKMQCQLYSKIEHVRVENDTVAWARGAATLQRLLSASYEYPTLSLTFGTCPGGAVMPNSSSAMGLELYLVNWPFVATNACRGTQKVWSDTHDQELFSSSPPVLNRATAVACDLLSSDSVQWIRSECPEETKVQEIFTTRVAAYVHDILESLEKSLGIKVRTVFIGGGNAEAIDNDQLFRSLETMVRIFNTRTLEPQKISPDLISLLGSLDGLDESSCDTVFPEKSLALFQALHDYYSKSKQ